VGLVRTDVSEELVKRLSSQILVTLMMEEIRSHETYVLKRATRRHIPEDGILHSHRRENLKPYVFRNSLSQNVPAGIVVA
jgi:hypothetical protein